MIVAGVDEVGRGPIAGPLVVVAAAFEVDAWSEDSPPVCPVKNVKDSKAFSSRSKREQVAEAILGCPLLKGTGFGAVSAVDITSRGMSWALKSAFTRSVTSLPVVPDLVFVDGVVGIPGWAGKQMFGPKGDSRWWPVSAASIIAKVARDRWMEALDLSYPGYDWKKNSGYGTADHYARIAKLGLTPIHRTDFIHLDR